MKEKDLNTIINRSFLQLGFSHKIADPMAGTGIQNPFDGFSVFKEKPWYWESKLIKGDFKSFNFNTVQQHQFDNLKMIKRELGNTCYSLVIVGIFIPYKELGVFVFDVDYLLNLRERGINSLKKKDLLEFKEKGFFCSINRKDRIIDYIDEVDSKIIFES